MKELSFTHIKEPVRAHFGISRDEYALCSYIQVWGSHIQNRLAPFCNRYQSQMATWVGISRSGVIKMLNRLVTKKLIEQEANGPLYSVTKLWYEAVNMAEFKPAIVDYESEIECVQSTQGVDKVNTGGVDKVNTKCVQSEHQGVYKVNTHIESIVSNNKLTIVTKEKQTEIEEKKDGWEVPGDALNIEESVDSKTENLAALFDGRAEKLLNNAHLPIKLNQCGVKLMNDEHLEILITKFRTHCLATEEMHISQSAFNKHFFNYTASRGKVKTLRNGKSSNSDQRNSKRPASAVISESKFTGGVQKW